MRDPTFEAHDAEMRMTFLHPFFVAVQLQKPFPRSSVQSSDCKSKKLSNGTKLSRSANGCTIAMPQHGDLKTKLSQGARFGRGNEVAMKFNMWMKTLM